MDFDTHACDRNAELVVKALDAYLSTFPWPDPKIGTDSNATAMCMARMSLVRAISVMIKTASTPAETTP